MTDTNMSDSKTLYAAFAERIDAILDALTGKQGKEARGVAVSARQYRFGRPRPTADAGSPGL